MATSQKTEPGTAVATTERKTPAISDRAKEIVEQNLPKMGDSEETLHLKEQTINRFVQSKVATPILDAHAPGWRKPSTSEANAALGAKPMGR